MKIEVLETFLHGDERFEKGDRRTVDQALGVYFCKAGWVKDLDGKIETSPRDPHRVVTLDIHNVQMKTSAEVK